MTLLTILVVIQLLIFGAELRSIKKYLKKITIERKINQPVRS